MVVQDKGRKALLEQAAPGQAAPATYTALNSLVYSAPALGKRSVQSDLWSGCKAIDLKVTHKAPPPGELSATKAAAWARHSVPERSTQYGTTTRRAEMQAAILSQPPAPNSLRAVCGKAVIAAAAEAEGGEGPTIGRKVTGGMAAEVDLRVTMFEKLEFRKPIDYTVTWTVKDDGAPAAADEQVVPSAAAELTGACDMPRFAAAE